ncbi:hypothetical protein B1C78_00615 [Thioalkalivibrio denitrificans]|uniref:YdbS-like PH domain-containing protein n=1 Tax=Thioalkalivibrio denitrificans TaxID=108003 RepID=A0A1V3NUQ4_9GAMM|nr:PH domain-containing protein [Thioalkalivibrio denitrificans]OOG28869.1 hypothetical protein B1C78_00615 [Thioalkalivibrio denitrificans]
MTRNDIDTRADGSPFATFDEAAAMRDLVSRETGSPWVVAREGIGFTIRPGRGSPQDSASPGAALSGQTSLTPGVTRGTPVDAETLILRPAWRCGWPLMIVALAAAAGVFNADRLALLFMGADLVTFWNRWSPISPGETVALLSAAAMIFALGSLLVWRYGHRYTITPMDVEMRVGIIRRETRTVRMKHIRSVGLRQGFWDRLVLKVGDLEIASSGSGDADDVAFRRIVRPARVREHINSLMHDHGA